MFTRFHHGFQMQNYFHRENPDKYYRKRDLTRFEAIKSYKFSVQDFVGKNFSHQNKTKNSRL